MRKSIKESVEFMSPEYIRLDNIKVMKLRCKSFLKPEPGENHKAWVKEDNRFCISKYNVVAPDDGEDYHVNSQLERTIEGRKISYKLSFGDIKEFLDDQSYKPLRTLGNLVFNNSRKN